MANVEHAELGASNVLLNDRVDGRELETAVKSLC
jgi:hypothetical protein